MFIIRTESKRLGSGLYKPALSDAKASLSDGFGAFCIVIIPGLWSGCRLLYNKGNLKARGQ